MFTLAAPPEPEWLTLIEADGDAPAVRVLFAPVGALARDAASDAVAIVMADADPEVRDEIKDAFADGSLKRTLSADGEALLRKVGRASARAMISEGIRDWTGIGDPEGNPVPASAATIKWFLENETLFKRSEQLYVMPIALRDAEKNGLAGSPDGIGMQATPARATASSPAARAKPAAAAIRKRKPRAARTSSTGRKPKAG